MQQIQHMLGLKFEEKTMFGIKRRTWKFFAETFLKGGPTFEEHVFCNYT